MDNLIKQKINKLDQNSKVISFLGKKIEIPDEDATDFEKALFEIHEKDSEATDKLSRGNIFQRFFTSIRQAFGNVGFNREKHIDRLRQHSPRARTVREIIDMEISDRNLYTTNFTPTKAVDFLKKVEKYLKAENELGPEIYLKNILKVLNFEAETPKSLEKIMYRLRDIYYPGKAISDLHDFFEPKPNSYERIALLITFIRDSIK